MNKSNSRPRPVCVVHGAFKTGYVGEVEVDKSIKMSDCLEPIVRKELEEFDASIPVSIGLQKIQQLSNAWSQWLAIEAWSRDGSPIKIDNDGTIFSTAKGIKFRLELITGFNEQVKQVLAGK